MVGYSGDNAPVTIPLNSAVPPASYMSYIVIYNFSARLRTGPIASISTPVESSAPALRVDQRIGPAHHDGCDHYDRARHSDSDGDAHAHTDAFIYPDADFHTDADGYAHSYGRSDVDSHT